MKGATPNEKQLEKNKNHPHKSKVQTAKASRENIHKTKKELEKSKNDLRRFREQVPRADAVNAEQLGANKNGLQNSKRDPVEQQSVRRLHWVWATRNGNSRANPNNKFVGKNTRITYKTLKVKLQMKNTQRKHLQDLRTVAGLN